MVLFAYAKRLYAVAAPQDLDEAREKAKELFSLESLPFLQAASRAGGPRFIIADNVVWQYLNTNHDGEDLIVDIVRTAEIDPNVNSAKRARLAEVMGDAGVEEGGVKKTGKEGKKYKGKNNRVTTEMHLRSEEEHNGTEEYIALTAFAVDVRPTPPAPKKDTPPHLVIPPRQAVSAVADEEEDVEFE